MTSYAIELRYPDDFYIPSRKETEKAYADALKVKILIVSKIKDKC
jgi:hypothetical protein